MAFRLALVLTVTLLTIGTDARLHQNTKKDRQLQNNYGYNGGGYGDWSYGYQAQNGNQNYGNQNYGNQNYRNQNYGNQNGQSGSADQANDMNYNQNNYQNGNGQNNNGMEWGYDENGNWVNMQEEYGENWQGGSFYSQNDAEDEWEEEDDDGAFHFGNHTINLHLEKLKFLHVESQMEFYRMLSIFLGVVSLVLSLYVAYLRLELYYSTFSRSHSNQEALAPSTPYTLPAEPDVTKPNSIA